MLLSLNRRQNKIRGPCQWKKNTELKVCQISLTRLWLFIIIFNNSLCILQELEWVCHVCHKRRQLVLSSGLWHPGCDVDEDIPLAREVERRLEELEVCQSHKNTPLPFQCRGIFSY